MALCHSSAARSFVVEKEHLAHAGCRMRTRFEGEAKNGVNHVTQGLTARIFGTSGCPWSKATVKPPVWNPGPKIEIPHPENHVLKFFRFWSWKSWVWKSRPQNWDPKSWKPCPKNHILKFPPITLPTDWEQEISPSD